MGRKVLGLDADDPEALVLVAEVLTERTRDSDLDKDQRWAEAEKYAKHATETIETDVSVPAGTPQEKMSAYKSLLRSNAYSILGTLAFRKMTFRMPKNYCDNRLMPSHPAQIRWWCCAWRLRSISRIVIPMH